MRHLFVIDPLLSLNRDLDSSLRMMFELSQLGHDIFVAEPRRLSMRTGPTRPTARCQRLAFGENAAEFSASEPEIKTLADFRAIHMRKDPPYDLDYIASTWLLDPARDNTRVYNDPIALQRYNEKLAIFQFPQDARPALVSTDAEELLAFIETECMGDAVLKPLTLFGGRGVFRLTVGAKGQTRAEALAILRQATAEGTSLRLAQAFDKAIFEGEVRAFTAFGEPIAWCLKQPAPGEFLANTRMGARLLPYQPTAVEDERVRRVAKALLKEGVAFLGFDLIGGYLSEINLTSPRLLTPPGEAGDAYQRIAAMIQDDLAPSRG